MYVRPLNVSTPEGRRIEAEIIRMQDQIQVVVPFLEVVKKDNPPFAKDGVIHFPVERKNYEETIIKLEKYLEDLFLKGMADEDLHRSLRIEPKSGRVKAARLSRKARSTKRKGSPAGLHFGTRRGEPTESDRPGNSDVEVAPSSYSNFERQDQDRD